MKRVVSVTLFLILILGCARDGVARSSFWKKVTGPAGAYVTTFTYTTRGEVLAGTFKGIFRSPDGGKSWGRMDGDLEDEEIWTFVAHPGGDLFAGTSNGIFRSHDEGSTWDAVATEFSDARVNALVVNTEGLLFAGTDQGVFRSQDNGENWTEISDGLADDLVYIESIVFSAEGDVYAATYHGRRYREVHVYHFDNVQQRWVQLPDVSDRLSDLAINTRGYLFAGTFGDGVYRSDVSLSPGSHPTAVEQIGDDIPQGFFLAQNYPNPFNPQTRITFQQATENDIQLVVYNTLGQVVRRLVDRRYPAGTFRAEWDGRDDTGQTVASGVYFYRLTAGSFTQVRTMVLLR